MTDSVTRQPAPSQAYVYNGLVTRIIDGDTIEIVADLGFYLSSTQRFRLVNVNTPETRGASRPAGLVAKDYTMTRLLGKRVVIRTTKADSFGRWLVHVWVAGDGQGDRQAGGQDGHPEEGALVDFNAELVERGYAVAYREGTGGA